LAAHARAYFLFVWAWAIPPWAAAVYAQLRAMVRLNRQMVKQGWIRLSPYAAEPLGGFPSLTLAASWVGYPILASEP
jgi:hypothetical protein